MAQGYLLCRFRWVPLTALSRAAKSCKVPLFCRRKYDVWGRMGPKKPKNGGSILGVSYVYGQNGQNVLDPTTDLSLCLVAIGYWLPNDLTHSTHRDGLSHMVSGRCLIMGEGMK